MVPALNACDMAARVRAGSWHHCAAAAASLLPPPAAAAAAAALRPLVHAPVLFLMLLELLQMLPLPRHRCTGRRQQPSAAHLQQGRVRRACY